MEELDLKIARLKNILELKGYYGQVHINGIEQGTLERVIKSCFALKYGGRSEDFKDPVVMTHYSYNESHTEYMAAKFTLELDHPERIKIRNVLFENCNREHDVLAFENVLLAQNMDTPTLARARQMVCPNPLKKRVRKRKGL